MDTPTRRTLLTAAVAAAATVPALASAQTEGGGDEGVLVLPSRAAAARAKIAAGVGAVLCTGFARAGDRGQGLYARVAAEPNHAGKFRSADGAWWELAENRLNPFMFGAKARNGVDDSGAIQAMFDFVAAKTVPYPMEFMGARYLVQRPLTLPTVQALAPMDIDGGGGALITDRPITILSRLPKNQGDAMRVINSSPYDIHHLEFHGTGAAGQIGVHIGAAYSNVVRNCQFARLDYGSIGSFCLGSAWRDNLYFACAKRGAVIQTGRGYDDGEIWPGASETNSASNVNVFENCRVFGHPKQTSAFGIFGSDAARVSGCISEGLGANVDLHFDFQASPTVKQFHVDMFHCEAPNAKLNFKIRASGKVTIERIIRSYPAAILDTLGSGAEVIIRSMAWLGELPEATGKGPNPNGRWFYHCDGGGFGGAAEGGISSGMSFRFEDCIDSAYEYLTDPKRWEGGKLPYMLHVRGTRRGNGGVLEWSNAPISFHSPVSFMEGELFAGIASGKVSPRTASVPARGSISERFVVEGMGNVPMSFMLNPRSSADAPPPGIAWNSHFEADGSVILRLTNVTDQPIALKADTVWTWTAPRGR